MPPEKVLVDLAQALCAGCLIEAATAFMVCYAAPAVGEAAAIELSSLFASGLTHQHAALLLDARHGVVLREVFAEAEHRVLVVGFVVQHGRDGEDTPRIHRNRITRNICRRDPPLSFSHQPAGEHATADRARARN